MKKIILYTHHFSDIGGTETFIINFVKLFHDLFNITVITEYIGLDNLKSLSKYVPVITELTEEITCDALIINSNAVSMNTLNLVKRGHAYRVMHLDMKEMNKVYGTKYYLQEIPDSEWISVSQSSHDGLLEEYGIESIIIPCITVPSSENKKLLRLCSATRLTEEKGYKRMKKLCDIFELYNIPYVWDVYTQANKRGKVPRSYKNMVCRVSKKDICSYYNNYDYVVQLSDTESFCYTMYESLINGIPVLVTPFPNAKADIKDGKNGYILPFDMNIDEKLVHKIYSEIPTNIEFKPEVNPVDLWKKLLK